MCGPRCDATAPEGQAGCRDYENCVRASDDDVAACLPNCSKAGCDEGFFCLALGSLSKCVVRHGPDCTKTPCPGSQACQVDIENAEAYFHCRTRCDSMTGRGCADGEVCGRGAAGASYCYRPCTPSAATRECPMGESCSSVSEDGKLLGCR
jgi:hypothetical protein